MAESVMRKEDLERLWQDDRHWWKHTVYHCPADPRIIVPQRHRIGWTWNFAHPWAVPTVLLAVLLVGVPAWILCASGRKNPWMLLGVLALTLVVGVPILLWVSNRVAEKIGRAHV